MKFTFKFSGRKYKMGDESEEKFDSDIGKWMISVSRSRRSFFLPGLSVKLLLSPSGIASSLTALNGLNIRVKFNILSLNPEENQHKNAINRDDFPLFEVFFKTKTQTEALHCEFEIEVDATSWLEDLPLNSSIQQFAKEMFETGKLADIKIKTPDEKEINVNKFMLSRSPVFNAMLNLYDTKEAHQGVIEITDIKHEVLVEMIRYMYTDEILKLKEMALELLVAADKYNLPGLSKRCNDYLKLNVTIENFAEILVTSEKINAVDLQKAAKCFVIGNHKSVLLTDSWISLEREHAQLATTILKECIDNLQLQIDLQKKSDFKYRVVDDSESDDSDTS